MNNIKKYKIKCVQAFKNAIKMIVSIDDELTIMFDGNNVNFIAVNVKHNSIINIRTYIENNDRKFSIKLSTTDLYKSIKLLSIKSECYIFIDNDKLFIESIQSSCTICKYITLLDDYDILRFIPNIEYTESIKLDTTNFKRIMNDINEFDILNVTFNDNKCVFTVRNYNTCLYFNFSLESDCITNFNNDFYINHISHISNKITKIGKYIHLQLNKDNYLNVHINEDDIIVNYIIKSII